MPGEQDLPGDALAFAARVLGPCELVNDCSWEHRMSSVLRLRDAGGQTWFLKRHRDRERYETERRAYRQWVPALGGRAPWLRAFDDSLGAIVISAIPGQPAPWPAPEAGDPPDACRPAEEEVQRQAGMLLRRFHDAQEAVPCEDFGAAKAEEFDRLLPRAAHLLTPREREIARSAVTALDGIPGTGLVPCHRDYTPRNWLVDNGVVRVVDFEWTRLDARISDLARLHLGIWAIRPDLRDAFLGGYGLRLGDTDRAVLRACAVVTAAWLMAVAVDTGRPSFAEANRDSLLRLLASDLT